MLNRRDFMRITGAGVAAGVALGRTGTGSQSEAHAAGAFYDMPGRIVQITDPNAMLDKTRVNKEVAEKMVDQVLIKLTGESTAVGAIKRFVKADDVVGVHPNCLGCPHSAANPAVTFRVVQLLLEAGIPPANIIVYDQYGGRMRKAGYKLGKRPDGVVVAYHKDFGLRKEASSVDAGQTHLIKLVDKLTAIINIAAAKDHDLAGVTGALKLTAFGNIERVPVFHRTIHKTIPQIYSLPELKGKMRLHILDALKVLYNGGPQDKDAYRAVHNSILATTDPVTCDAAILAIVDEHRAKHNLPLIRSMQPPARKNPSHIANAAAMGLGVADLEKIKWEKLTLA